MKGKVLLVLAIVGMFIMPMMPATKAAYAGDIAVIDISCASRPITYDNDEQFQAWLSNDGSSSVTVEVKWYLDDTYVINCYVTVPAGGNSWTPKVTIHWPDDFRYHKVTAKAIISDSDSSNNERSEWFRASLITT
jgi:hypothetical protein